jgi:hypothetical protein
MNTLVTAALSAIQAKLSRSLFSAIFLAAATTPATAATIWTGADGASLTTAGNWNNGLPSLINTGTIPNGTLGINFNASVTDWVVVQDGGALTASTFRQFNGGSWTMNGGSIQTPSNFQLAVADNKTQVFTLNAGTIDVTGGWIDISTTGTNRFATMNVAGGAITVANNLRLAAGGTYNQTNGTTYFEQGISASSGSTFLFSGGNLTMGASRSLTVNSGGNATIYGGTLTITQDIVGAGIVSLDGGTINVGRDLNFSTAGLSLVLGGTNAGALTAVNWRGTADNRNVNWLSGSLMTMTLTGAANWAETEWAADRMFFNGDSATDLGLSWTQVTDPLVGFNAGGGTYFDWDGTSRTLALVTVPEPASLTAVGLVGLLVLARVHRRRLKVRPVEA